ncbi:hypothetical protein Droror1_Dr00000320 [Drosera rotundifolia]
MPVFPLWSLARAQSVTGCVEVEAGSKCEGCVDFVAIWSLFRWELELGVVEGVAAGEDVVVGMRSRLGNWISVVRNCSRN